MSSQLDLQIAKVMPGYVAAKYGFPVNPDAGEVITDAAGNRWMWFPPGVLDDQLGDLGELGFWGALISAVAGIGSSLFGGKGDKQAREVLQQHDQAISQLQQQVATMQQRSEGAIKKKTIMVLGFGLLAVLIIMKGGK